MFINSLGCIVNFDFYSVESMGMGLRLWGVTILACYGLGFSTLSSWPDAVAITACYGPGFYHQILLFLNLMYW